MLIKIDHIDKLRLAICRKPIDEKLLTLLKADARVSVSTLVRQLEASRATAQEHIVEANEKARVIVLRAGEVKDAANAEKAEANSLTKKLETKRLELAQLEAKIDIAKKAAKSELERI